MKCSVFIATSADGYIATKDGDVEWLEKAGKPDADMGEQSDMGFENYMASIDCMIMGRKCMETVSSFNLTPEQWPYGSTRIFVLSNTVKEAPDNLKGQVEMYSGEIPALMSRLESEGFQHAYIDGGTTITSFLNLGLINEMTVTRAPILLGEGIPLIGKTNKHIKLEDSQAAAYPNEFIQIKYRVNYL
ncbi:MAG: dihydrofolate reductase [Planctomycetes bacterium]|nr:dihydrofolate reductase [Planctomycetota bacterium]